MTFSDDPRMNGAVITAPSTNNHQPSTCTQLDLELALATGAVITRTGLRFDQKPTFEQFEQTLDIVLGMRDMAQFSKLDLVNYGRREFGAERVAQALRQRDVDQGELDLVFRLEALVERRADLTIEHQLCVTRLDETDQKRWLDLARIHKLTPGDLRASIRAGEVCRQETGVRSQGSGGSNGSSTARVSETGSPLHHIANHFNQWLPKAAEQMAAWSIEDWRIVIELLTPIARLHQEAKDRVSKAEQQQRKVS